MENQFLLGTLNTLGEKITFHNMGRGRKGREGDKDFWNNVFIVLNKIRSEIKEYLPYKNLEV